MNDAAMRCPRPGTGGSGNSPHASWGMSLPGLPGILSLVSACVRASSCIIVAGDSSKPSAVPGAANASIGAAACVVFAWGRPATLARPMMLDADRPSHRRRVSAASSHNLVFCPVAGCCKGDPERSSGWSSHQGLRHHLDDHCSGVYSGAIPQQYLDEHGLDLCSVCASPRAGCTSYAPPLPSVA